MNILGEFPLLNSINTPDDLRLLPESKLEKLSHELREYLVQCVSQTGGHLSAGLGTVELTIAIHYVFNTPEDRLVWDVGHQSYPHKILTGRREKLLTIRKQGGISGFPKRSESPYDTFGVGHSSTSISAAVGMAIASKLEGIDRKTIAVIGDGAMTAGMAFEALNHASDLDANMLVILNDNDMSISPNVGGMSNYLARILSGRVYSTVREGSKKVLASMPTVWELARKAEEHVKGMVVPGTLFEELGFNYIGPIDGHDLDTLVTTLKNIRSLKGPQFLHIVTKKGKGFSPAEENPCAFHGVSTFDPVSGKNLSQKSKGPTYTEVFGQWICDMAQSDDKLIGITPAMREGSGLVQFSQQFPDRYFDVGIAEQHAVTFAAGLACEGFKPVVAIYSTFLQRAYDQLIHDVAIQNLPVLFAIDRAGVVGPDGATHAGSFDMSYLRCIPNMVIMAPTDENECRQMLTTGFQHDGPSAVRYPRSHGPGKNIVPKLSSIRLGKAVITREGIDIAILAFGSMHTISLEAAEVLNATVVNMRFVKPLDADKICDLASKHKYLITIEENSILGGAGSAVNECLLENGLSVPIINLGLPDVFLSHGTREQLLADCGLTTDGIIKSANQLVGQNACQTRSIQVNS